MRRFLIEEAREKDLDYETEERKLEMRKTRT